MCECSLDVVQYIHTIPMVICPDVKEARGKGEGGRRGFVLLKKGLRQFGSVQQADMTGHECVTYYQSLYCKSCLSGCAMVVTIWCDVRGACLSTIN